MKDNGSTESCCGCGCMLFLLISNLVLGGWSVNYLLMLIADKTIPFFWAVVIGLFAGEFTFPVAVITWILKFCRVL